MITLKGKRRCYFFVKEEMPKRHDMRLAISIRDMKKKAI